jgi:predicted secreted Zn-dependent protease
MFFAPPPAVVVPDTMVVERNNHYDIKATTEPEIVHEMQAKGPAGFDSTYWAYTNAGVSFSYDTHQVGAYCVLVKPNVHVSINITLPAWTLPPGTRPAVVAKWNALYKAIVHHEGEHAQIARDSGDAITALLRSHPRDSSCKKLDAYLQEKAAPITAAREKANSDLDARTQHGAKEGVAISW